MYLLRGGRPSAHWGGLFHIGVRAPQFLSLPERFGVLALGRSEEHGLHRRSKQFTVFLLVSAQKGCQPGRGWGPRADGEGWGSPHSERGDPTGSGKEALRHFKMSPKNCKPFF